MHVIRENVSMSDVDGNATKKNVEIFKVYREIIFNGGVRLT